MVVEVGFHVDFLREKLKETEFCERLRFVPCVAFLICDQSFELESNTVN